MVKDVRIKKNTCEFCNKSFSKDRNAKGRFCSIKCYHDDIKSIKPDCIGCGKVVSSIHTTRCKKCEDYRRKGENHPLWINDRTTLKRYVGCEERRSPAYKTWRKSVLDRDGWKCKMCQEKVGLVAHHILSFTKFAELKYDINNGITLCQAHHPRKRADEAKLSPFFQNMVAEMK